MIISFEDLERYRGKVALVDGGFDPLHAGHLRYFEEAKKLGLPLVCSVAADEYVAKKHPVLLSSEQRVALLDALHAIDYVLLNVESTASVLNALRPRFYVKGNDWEGKLPAEECEACANHSIEIIYLDTILDSSSRIVQEHLSRQATSFEAQVSNFENLVFEQKPVQDEHYSEEYFASEWRDEGNRYTIDVRREIEGKNPELIKSVFSPKRVLDFGCGPGMLMEFLREIGVDADGLDFSPASPQIAPPGVRDRIKVGEVTDFTIFPDNSYDLLICREVLEHLTVLQVKRCIQNMCRISSQFVYVTTRYHPNPDSLLSVTTQFDVDPSHITLMNKEFMKVLFVLEGFKERHDLEAKMDWMDKRRVLVFEKVETVV